MKTFSLLQYEMDALVDALRRDMRTELNRVSSDPENADIHNVRARLNIRLLEALRPKTVVSPAPVYKQTCLERMLVEQL